jgi:hypothetical protein
MRILKFIVWTLCAMGLGVFLSTYEVKGKTPLQYLEHTWRAEAPRVRDGAEKVKDGAEDLVDDVKKKIGSKSEKPTERHSVEDREAIDKLIARRAQK